MNHNARTSRGLSLEDELERLMQQPPLPDHDYFHVTLRANEQDRITWSASTVFVGWANDKPGLEKREASRVRAGMLRQSLASIGQPPTIVNDRWDLFIFLILGGHAIIEAGLAAEFLPDVVAESTVAPAGYFPGFVCIESLPKQKLAKRPRSKTKAAVLRRDGNRCAICARGPDDAQPASLTLHHITVRHLGGLTEEKNLLTLCEECHTNLKPHQDVNLYQKIGIDPYEDPHRESYEADVFRYRRKALAVLRSLEGRESCGESNSAPSPRPEAR